LSSARHFSAAAHNKLGNNEQALNDCFRSLQIDPNYSKSYGRLGYVNHVLFKLRSIIIVCVCV